MCMPKNSSSELTPFYLLHMAVRSWTYHSIARGNAVQVETCAWEQYCFDGINAVMLEWPQEVQAFGTAQRASAQNDRMKAESLDTCLVTTTGPDMRLS